jgi:hypothetical protein
MAMCRQNTFVIAPRPQLRGDQRRASLALIALALAAFAAIARLDPAGQQLLAADPLVHAAEDPIADDNDPRVKAAIARAANFLRRNGTPGQVGELSLRINALAKIRSKFPDLIPPDDPVLAEMVAALRDRCLPRFQPSLVGGHDNYEAGCAAMALAAVSRTEHAAELRSIADYLLKKQLANGAWSYDGPAAPGGDTSMTQYALLGLWEANNGGGGPVPKAAWDKAANWLVTRQAASGGYCYHPPDPGPGVVQPEPTHTMTVASLGSLYLCRDHLPGGKRRDNLGVLQPIEPKAPADNFKPQTKPESLRVAIDSATRWLVQNFTLDKARGEADPGGGRWLYYYLYAFERFATLAEQKTIADVDWYSKAAGLIIARQQASGSWSAGNGDVVDTSFAALFLVRSTMQILKEKPPRNIGPGTLVVFDPSRLPGWKKSSELFDSIDADAAEKAGKDSVAILSGDLKVYVVGPKAVAAWKELEKGYAAKDMDRIIAALKALARTHDLRVVPLLIDAMYYEDARDEHRDVMLAARDALCLISRRFEPKYTGKTVEDWETEIAKWKAWYRSVRPQADAEDDVPLR